MISDPARCSLHGWLCSSFSADFEFLRLFEFSLLNSSSNFTTAYQPFDQYSTRNIRAILSPTTRAFRSGKFSPKLQLPELFSECFSKSAVFTSSSLVHQRLSTSHFYWVSSNPLRYLLLALASNTLLEHLVLIGDSSAWSPFYRLSSAAVLPPVASLTVLSTV